jgi:hypothetical protein
MSTDEWLSDEEIIGRWEQQGKERTSRSGKKHSADADDEGGTGDEKGRKPKQADILIGVADNAALFHTPAPDDDAFADVVINGHRETHRVRGRIFRGWLRHKYFELTGSACNSEALQVTIDTVEAKARYKGPEQPVHIRIAGTDDAIYIDLGDLAWKAIKATASGWQIVDEPPVRFTRSQSTKPLPIPERGGSIKLLQPFCNLKTSNEFVVLVGHVLATLRPDANYPVLVTTGEQGSCKSTLFRLIVRLVDPRSPELRSLSKDEDALITAAKCAHALSFDNISGIPVWLSDAICRLATGGGAGKRKLYSDDDEILFDGRRPTFLNGIEDVVTRGDLVDRSNIFSLEVIAENKRRTEAEIDGEFAQKAPKILGALLDGLVAGLNNLSSVKIPEKPRMADFALWAEACTRAYWRAGRFMKAYRENLAASVELVLEASTVGTAVRRFMQTREEWSGTAQELLGLLTPLVGEQVSREREWPKRPNTLSGKLKRAAPALRKVGIHVTRGGRAGHAGERVSEYQPPGVQRRRVDVDAVAVIVIPGRHAVDLAEREQAVAQTLDGDRDNLKTRQRSVDAPFATGEVEIPCQRALTHCHRHRFRDIR